MVYHMPCPNPIPYNVYRIPYTVYPIPYTLYPIPYTLYPILYPRPVLYVYLVGGGSAQTPPCRNIFHRLHRPASRNEHRAIQQISLPQHIHGTVSAVQYIHSTVTAQPPRRTERTLYHRSFTPAANQRAAQHNAETKTSSADNKPPPSFFSNPIPATSKPHSSHIHHPRFFHARVAHDDVGPGPGRLTAGHRGR